MTSQDRQRRDGSPKRVRLTSGAVYEKRNHAGRWVCVTRSGGSTHDLRG